MNELFYPYKIVEKSKPNMHSKPNILCTISLAISYVSPLYVLIIVQCRTISNAMTRTGS